MSAQLPQPSADAGGQTQPVIAYKTRPPDLPVSLWRICRVVVFGYDIFLSHSHRDEEGRNYALALWPRLEELGLTTCFDKTDFHPGERLKLKMKRSVTRSKQLLLLDTAAARRSEAIKTEVDAAKNRDVLVIRDRQLEKEAWPGLDGPDPIIVEYEPTEAFRDGRPRGDLPAIVRAKFRFTSVRTKFRMVAALVGFILLLAASWIGAERQFANQLAAVYASIHDTETPIVELEAAFDRLKSGLLGPIRSTLHGSELDLLDGELVRLQAKPMQVPWKFTETLAASVTDAVTFRAPLNDADLVVFSADRSAALAVQDGGVVVVDDTGAHRCQAAGGVPRRVAIDRAGGNIAVLADHGLHVWLNRPCTIAPLRVELPVPPTNVHTLAFGNGGRTLLVADAGGVMIYACGGDRGCRPTVTHRPPLPTPSQPRGATPRVCEAVVSPTSELAAAVFTVGDCSSGLKLCVLSRPRHCVPPGSHRAITFDPTGRWLLAARPSVTWWSVEGLVSDANGDAAVDKDEWHRAPGELVTEFEAMGFDRTGSRLVTAKIFPKLDEVAVLIYQFPELIPLQSMTFASPKDPIYVVANSRLIIGTAQNSSGKSSAATFDLRTDRRGLVVSPSTR